MTKTHDVIKKDLKNQSVKNWIYSEQGQKKSRNSEFNKSSKCHFHLIY